MEVKGILYKIWKIIMKILMVITAPIWFPWKVLFVRKKGNKFNDVDSNTKMWRLLRSPVTKTLKFCVFLFIILLEIIIVHKIRYSPITYPFTRNAVMNYYLNENKMEVDGAIENYQDEFQILLSYVEIWDLDEKNKMHNILNSDLVKLSLKYTDDATISYILNKFNNDEVFRGNVRIFIKDINSTITRFLKEIPEADFKRLNTFLGPIITVSSWAIDYAGALEIGGAVFKWEVEENNISEKSLKVSAHNIELAIKTGFDYHDGASLETVKSYW